MSGRYGRTRENNYDLLRICSTIAVITIHINYQYFEKRAYAPSDHIYYYIESILNIITRFSVPAFVMLSGAFLLSNPKNRDFVGFYKKTAFRIFLPAAVLMAVFFIYDEISAMLMGRSYLAPVKKIVTGSYYNLWYLYMLAGLYLLTPVMIRIKESVKESVFKKMGYLLLLWSVVSAASSWFRLAYDMGVVFSFLSYFIMGNVIYEEEKKRDCKSGGGILCIVMLLMVCLAFWARMQGMHYYLFQAYINFFSPAVAVYSICMFRLFSRMKVKRELSFLSGHTFYIYLFHTWVYETLFCCVPFPKNEIVSIVLAVALTFLLSFALAYLYQKAWNFGRLAKAFSFLQR